MAKILIIAPQWMGDAVMTHSLIQLVAKKNTVDVLCVSWLEPIYQRMQNVDNVITLPLQHGKLQLKLYWQIAKKIKNQYDQCIVIPRKLKSAITKICYNYTMRNQTVDIIIIGAGASGLMLGALLKNRDFLIIDNNPNVGSKILISGGGRCNITNAELDVKKFLENFSETKKFLYSPLAFLLSLFFDPQLKLLFYLTLLLLIGHSLPDAFQERYQLEFHLNQIKLS